MNYRVELLSKNGTKRVNSKALIMAGRTKICLNYSKTHLALKNQAFILYFNNLRQYILKIQILGFPTLSHHKLSSIKN